MARDEKFKRTGIEVTMDGWDKIVIVRFKGGVWTRFRVREYPSGLDIENTNTYPEHRFGEGYGTEALKILKRFAKNRGHKMVRARYAAPKARPFWTRSGFTPECTGGYVYEFDAQGKS
ncbi:MAG: hypothetical protein RLZZ283_433 [Candidatus Parcubacteria bacterium]|jgi:hypothetical protein